MRNKKLFYISIIVCLVPLVVGLSFYNQLPEQMPIHWNVAGEIDSYTSKIFALFGFPILLLLFHIFLVWITNKDPKQPNIPNIIASIIYFLIPIISNICSAFSINASLPNSVDISISTIMPILLGFIFLLIGNYLPKCKQSYTVGIKTPWALDDEDNWNKTHRLAGFIWIIGGLLIIIGELFLQRFMTSYFFIIVLMMALIPYIYSYLIYKKKKGS